MTDEDLDECLRRWRLILGGKAADGTNRKLNQLDGVKDALLGELYDDNLSGRQYGGNSDSGEDEGQRKTPSQRGGREKSRPHLIDWLGDVRHYFPEPVAKLLQQDAIDRVGLQKMLADPHLLELIEPDVSLVATLVSLKQQLPEQTKRTARIVIKKVVDELMKKLANRTRQTLIGALNRAVRNYRPRHNEIDWHRTIQANLKHYQEAYKTIIPERLIGYGRKRSSLKDVILCIDQSGSMGTSVVYSSVFGAVMASLPAIKTYMVLFDTAVVDVTADLHDPVEVLFATQLGGGTHIDKALTYCQQLVSRPQDTILVLISDLFEGQRPSKMMERVTQLKESGVEMVVLLALNDDGAPRYNHDIAAQLLEQNIPSFACTPDLFPDLMATLLNKGDITSWLSKQGIMMK